MVSTAHMASPPRCTDLSGLSEDQWSPITDKLDELEDAGMIRQQAVEVGSWRYIVTDRGRQAHERQWRSFSPRLSVGVPCRTILNGLPRQLRDPVEGNHVRHFFAAAILHHVGVFGRVVVEVAQHGDGPKAARAEEKLGGEVRLAHFEQDPAAALLRELADQLRRSSACRSRGGGSGRPRRSSACAAASCAAHRS